MEEKCLNLQEKSEGNAFLAGKQYKEIKYNLFSLGAALDKGITFKSAKTTCHLFKGEDIVAVGVLVNKLYNMRFKVTSDIEDNLQANVAVKEGIKTWHIRLVHQNLPDVKKVLTNNGIQFKEEDKALCEDCIVGKIHRTPFPKGNTNTNQRIPHLVPRQKLGQDSSRHHFHRQIIQECQHEENKMKEDKSNSTFEIDTDEESSYEENLQ
ncbi:hypothetical protein CBL_05218 [Carabus blaptoides fortunei]